MKVKSSIILAEALKLIESGEQSFACAAILEVETCLRWKHKENVTSKASQIFERFKPKHVPETQKLYSQWWATNSPDRIVAIKAAIEAAKKQND